MAPLCSGSQLTKSTTIARHKRPINTPRTSQLPQPDFDLESMIRAPVGRAYRAPHCRESPAHSPSTPKIKSLAPTLLSAASSPSVGGAVRSISVEGSPTNIRRHMSNALATNNAARSQDRDRNDVLNAIGAKWNKFSKQELSALTTNDELVA